MRAYEEIKKIWNFYSSDENNQEYRTTLKVRLYNLIGMVLTPILTLVNIDQYNSFNIYCSGIIFLLCSSQFVLTFILKKYNFIADKVLYFSYYIYIFYTLSDAFYKDFEVESTFGYVIILFAIIMVISKPKRVIAFLIFNFCLSTPYIIMANDTEIEKSFLFSFFFVFYVLGTVVIRGRHETARKLVERENFLKALFNQSYDAFFLVNFYSKEIVDCNNVAVSLFQAKSKEEIVGKTRDKFKVLPFSEEELINIKHGLQQKGSWSSEQEYETVKGKKFIANVIITTLEVDKSNFYVVRITDLTESKIAEKKYRNLFERNLAGVYKVRSTDNILVNCNDAFAKILGYSDKKEIIGENCFNLYIESSDNNLFREYVKEKGQLINHETKIKLNDGSVIWTMENTTTIIEPTSPEYIEGTMINITELKTAQQNLQQTEANRNLLLSSLNVLVYTELINETGKTIDYISPQVETVFGYTKEIYNSGKMDIKEQYHPEDLKSIQTKTEEILETKQAGTLLYRFYHVKTKKQIWIEESIFPQYDESEIHIANFGVARDVTDRIDQEEALKHSEERFKLLSEASQEGIIIHDKGKVLEVNDLLCKLVGYSKEELLGANAYDIIEEKFKNIAKQKETEGTTEPYQVKIIKKDNTAFIGEVLAREIPYQGKQVRVAAVRDITGKIEAEKELIESRERFKEVVEHSPDGLIIHQGDQAIYVNDTALEMMGLDRFEDFVKTHYTNFIEEKFHAKTKKRMAKAAAGEKLDFEPMRLKRADGTFIDIESKPLRMNIGDKEVVLVVLHDITERLQLQKAQLRAELAEETNVELNKEIKERLKVEEELNTTQQYTKSIIESSLDVICANDESGKITEFNLAAQKTFGYTRQEVIGKNISILFVNKSEESRTFGALIENANSYTGEVQNKRKNGEEFTSYLAASALKNQAGKIIGSMGVSRDITEIRRAQNLLEQSEEQYRDLFENATDLIQSVDFHGNILFINNAWKKTLGYTEEETRSKTIFDIISPRQRTQWKEILGQIFKGEKFENIEVVFITKSGKEIVVEGNISCKLEDGKPTSTRGIFRNVTANRIFQNNLIEKEQQLSAIINNTEDLILSIDKHYNIIEYNHAVEELVKRKYGKKVVPGMSVFETVNPEWIEPFTAIYKKVFKGKTHNDVITTEEDGTTQYIESFYNPIKNAQGRITGIAIFSQDITDREVNEREIKRALNEKEILLKEVHHRVKNNLQVVSSILNLQSSYHEDENILKILSESQNRIKSMSFIHEVLYQTNDFSSIDFKEYILNLSKNLIHSYQIYEDLVELVLNVEKVLLNLDQAIPCGLIVNELFSNALKYAFDPNKSGSITIALTLSNEDDIKLIVKDDGKGLPNNFDFRKTESLGLQLVTTLVEQIDGTVNCETEEGKGTAFIIEFKKL